jgi:probable HAF family extracellular repeat protein
MAESMNDLGNIYDITRSSDAVGASAYGSVIVGRLSYGPGGYTIHALKYANGIMTDLGTLDGATSYGTQGGPYSAARGVSADGSVIVGSSWYAGGATRVQAFKYANGTMTGLGFLGGGNYSYADGVSADGSVIVGTALTLNNAKTEAFKYTNGTMTGLGNLGGNSGANNSSAYGVSGDGSVIVGRSWLNTTTFHAFKYADGIMTDLNSLAGSVGKSTAYAVSADGSTIVGNSYYTGGGTNFHAFKYANGTMTDLETLGGLSSTAYGVSADGSVIVGESKNALNKTRAFKYANGIMTDLGVLGGTSYTSSSAFGVSPDGLVIVGESSTASGTTHAFVYGAWANGGLVDVDNTYSAIAANGYQLNALLNAQNTALAVNLNSDCTVYDAHNVCVSVGGRYTNVGSPTVSQTAANIQLGYRFSPSFRAGVFLDQSIHNNAPSNYSVKNSQPLAGLFAVYSPSGTHLGVQVKASVAYSHKDVDITRPSLAFTEAGQGSTAMTTQGAQLETAYGFAVNDSWVASPLAGIRATSVVRNGYTETAGALFPVTYNSATRTATTAYVGAKVMGYVTPKMSVGASLGVERDLNSNISDNSGSIYYLGAYSLAAPDMSETRHFVAANADYSFEKNQRVSLSAYYNKQSLNASHGTTATLNYMIGF